MSTGASSRIRLGAGGATQPVSDRLLFFAVNLWCLTRYPRLCWMYLRTHRRFPNIAQPRAVNEKFIWRKVFDRDPRFTVVSDKLACKEWVRARVPDLKIPAVLWEGTDPDDIPDELLASSVVIKANHSWNTFLLIHDGQCDRVSLAAAARRWLRRRHGRGNVQWAYHDIAPRLFAEEMVADGGLGLQELKVYTFGTWIERVAHVVDRFGKKRIHVWDADADGRLARRPPPRDAVDPPSDVPLPPTLARALEIARRLGSEFDHMRVDLLTTADTLWFGELTVYNRGGRFTSNGADPDNQAARAWDLRRSAFLQAPPIRGWRGVYARALARTLAAQA